MAKQTCEYFEERHTHNVGPKMFEYSKEIGLDSVVTQQSRFNGEFRVTHFILIIYLVTKLKYTQIIRS